MTLISIKEVRKILDKDFELIAVANNAQDN